MDDDWIRESIWVGIISVAKQILSYKSPQELQSDRHNVTQSLSKLKAFANLINNFDLTPFTSHVEQLLTVVNDLTAEPNANDLKRVEHLSNELDKCSEKLELRQAECALLSQELMEKEAEIRGFKAEICKMEADLEARKKTLAEKEARLQCFSRECEGKMQRIEDKFDQVGKARVQELKAMKNRHQDLIDQLNEFVYRRN